MLPIMRKLFLLPIIVIMASPVSSQRSENEYRISRFFSADCGEEELFSYEGNNTNPMCVKRIDELYESCYIDSLFYDIMT